NLLESPDGQLIQSFSLHVFLPKPFPGDVFFKVADQRFAPLGTWQTVEGTFGSPVRNFQILARDSEAHPQHFAIDSIELVTVPEPRTLWLLIGVGVGGIVLRPHLKRLKKQACECP